MKRRFVIKMIVLEEVTSIEEARKISSEEIHSVIIDRDAGQTAEQAIALLEVILSDSGLDRNVES